MYRVILYRGFESPSLRQRRKKESYPRVAFFSSAGGEKQGPCGPCAGDSKGRAYRPGPLRIATLLPLRGSLARLRRAFVVLIRFRLSMLYGAQRISPCTNGGPYPSPLMLQPASVMADLTPIRLHSWENFHLLHYVL